MCLRLALAFFVSLAVGAGSAWAQGPTAERPVPPPGIAIAAADLAELRQGAADLGRESRLAAPSPRGSTGPPGAAARRAGLRERGAVRRGLRRDLQGDGGRRGPPPSRPGPRAGPLLRDGHAPWTTETGLVVRGYVSKIDGSVQPYGLVVPASYRPGSAAPAPARPLVPRPRRDAERAELPRRPRRRSPASSRRRTPSCCTPTAATATPTSSPARSTCSRRSTTSGRHYPIDDDRIAVRGFSMGGAACWQFAVHYPGRWAAPLPGPASPRRPTSSRSSRTRRSTPTWYEKKLWHLYDCTDYALNLFHCPTVAYSGEIDKQKQAADMMAEALAAGGPDASSTSSARRPGTATSPRPRPRSTAGSTRSSPAAATRSRAAFGFTTWTLRYNEVPWLRLDGLEQHWERARVDGEIVDGHDGARRPRRT